MRHATIMWQTWRKDGKQVSVPACSPMEEWTDCPPESEFLPMEVCNSCAIQGEGSQITQSCLLRKRSEMALCPRLTGSTKLRRKRGLGSGEIDTHQRPVWRRALRCSDRRAARANAFCVSEVEKSNVGKVPQLTNSCTMQRRSGMPKTR